ncbi:MAG: primosomal protein N' [Bacteroidota bacterium]
MASTEQFHPTYQTRTYVDVVLPIAIANTYTYYVPEKWLDHLAFGVRVEVQFGKNKLYSALVVKVHDEAPAAYQPKEIIAVIDERPIIYPVQYTFWQWIAQYYVCYLGEVMNAALPSSLKLSSETSIRLSPLYDHSFAGLSDQEFMITEALTIQEVLKVEDARQILQVKSIYPVIQRLLQKKIIYLEENIKEKFKPKKIHAVRLIEPYASQPDLLEEAFELCSRSTRQVEALMAFITLSQQSDGPIRRSMLTKKANVDTGVIRAIEKKGIWEIFEQEISRIGKYTEDLEDGAPLSPAQTQALQEVETAFKQHQTVLLHGVTGSGKTRIYVELIQKAIARREQVLYLLPEIALTTQIIQRLQRIFGDQIAVYHSRLNPMERAELWQKVAQGHSIVLGPRSALFLPYQNLSMIIIDEEHDPSFKQRDPAPRYHGRDAAIFLSHLHQGKVLLGTATPAIETFLNARSGKYGLVTLNERFGNLKMPNIELVDLKKEAKQRSNQALFSSQLIEEIKETLQRSEQVILFQNRRGYAPRLQCNNCGWTQYCIHCDVGLTYHKFRDQLQCHCCGYRQSVPDHCPACGSHDLQMKGFGTEKIEDDLKIYLPEVRVARFDLDTVRSKQAHARIIRDFEDQELDILVGTQMVTKGLDFDRVGLVGVLSADQLLHFPDFRATERAFQLITQVAGRAGRKHKQGKVLVQTYQPDNPVLQEVITYDYERFYQREIQERQSFLYPPYYRLIKITLKHKRPEILNQGARLYGQVLQKNLGDWVRGPAIPYISRVRSYYLLDFLIKLERKKGRMEETKKLLKKTTEWLHQQEGCSTIRVNIDVDPY